MSIIYTVTLNTSIDLFYEVPDIHAGKSLRANFFKRFASGKGINVARTFEVLKQKTVVIGIAGNDSLKLFSDLDSKYLTAEFVEARGETRTNTTISSTENNELIHVQSSGYDIDNSHLLKIKEILKNHSIKEKIVVLSGSLPHGAIDNTYEDMVNFCKKLGAYVVLDTSGPPLALGIRAKPDMIKPNIHELESCVGHSIKNNHEITNAIKNVCSSGINHVVVSMGEEGVIACKKNDLCAYQAKVSLDPQIKSYGNVGSGDAFIGGFLYGISTNLDFAHSAKLGVACGAANLLMLGPGACDLSAIHTILPQVSMTKIPLK